MYERYITFSDYFATGEGRTLEIQFCYADTPDEAIQKHLDRFYPKDMPAQLYFGPGVEAVLLSSQRAKEILTPAFKGVDTLLNILNNAGVEFYWKFYYNFS